MKLKDKTIIKMLVSLLIVLIFVGMFSTKVNAKYDDDYRYWNQKDTEDSKDGYRMGKYGCWVTAQAKLLYATGIQTSSNFNPDAYLEWERQNGYIDGNFNQTQGWNSPVKYAEQLGKTLVCFNGDGKVRTS